MNTPESPRPSLLFVDDEPRVLNAIRAVFRIGYDVTIATNGRDALAALRRQRFDVIVSDQRMPGMTGVEFLRQARRIAPDTVRILLSGFTDMDALVAAVNEVQVHRFLKKPWDNAALRRVVADAVALGRGLRCDRPPAPQPNLHPDAKQGLLVVDRDGGLLGRIQAEFGGRYQVISAPRLVACVEPLRDPRVRVLVCRLDVRDDGDIVALMQLKQDHPELVVITLCDESDGPYVTSLINRVGIFRFLREPGSFQLLANALHGAFERRRAR